MIRLLACVALLGFPFVLAAQDIESGMLVGTVSTLSSTQDQGSVPHQYGYFTRITLQNGIVTRSISGVCEKSCSAPGALPDVAVWTMERLDTSASPSAAVQITMTLNTRIAIQGGGGVVDAIKNQQSAEQYANAVKAYYQQQRNQERTAAQQMQANVSAFSARTTQINRDSFSSLASSFPVIPPGSITAARNFAAYSAIKSSPLSRREQDYDPVFARHLVQEFKTELAAHNYSGAFDIAQDLYDSNRRQDLAFLPEGWLEDGIFRPELSDPTLPVSPFAGTHMSTADSSVGGAQLRRVANDYGALWVESHSLANYSSASSDQYVTGIVLLREADQSFSKGLESEGAAYLRGSQTLLDVARGVRAGVMDSVNAIVDAAPALGKAFLSFAEAMYGDPSELYKATYQVLLATPDFARAVEKQIQNDITSIITGDAYERSRVISKITTDVVVGYATGAAFEGVAARAVIYDASLASRAAEELSVSLGRATSTSLEASRSAAVAPIVEEATIGHLLEGAESEGGTRVQVYRKFNANPAEEFEWINAETRVSDDGKVIYKNLTDGRRVTLRNTPETFGRRNSTPSIEILSAKGGAKKNIVIRYGPKE